MTLCMSKRDWAYVPVHHLTVLFNCIAPAVPIRQNLRTAAQPNGFGRAKVLLSRRCAPNDSEPLRWAAEHGDIWPMPGPGISDIREGEGPPEPPIRHQRFEIIPMGSQRRQPIPPQRSEFALAVVHTE